MQEGDTTKRPRYYLTDQEKWEIVRLRTEGKKIKEIAQKVGCSNNAVSLVFKKFLETGNVKQKPRSGRPPKVNKRDERRLVRIALKESRESSSKVTEIFNHGRNEDERITPSRARQILNKNKIKSYHVAPKWKITKENQKKRGQWAMEHLHWSVRKWQNVVFSDESILQRNTAQQFVRSVKGRVSLESSTISIGRWDPKIMVWGCISAQKVGRLVFIEGTVNGPAYKRLLENNLIQSFRRLKGGALLFQHDGAGAHKADDVGSFLEGNKILSLPWPAQSPDLNPIENLWAYLKRQLKASYDNMQDLRDDVERAWNQIDRSLLQSLYNSLPDKLQAVIKAKGGPTKF